MDFFEYVLFMGHNMCYNSARKAVVRVLEIILGEDWVANREEVYKKIQGDVQSRQGGRVLIVPELISHASERMLCTVAGATASRYAEVLPFTRLEDRVCEYTGIGMPEMLDGGGQIVALAAAARNLHSRVKVFAGMETKTEFLEQLLHMIGELKQCCIRPENLNFAAGKVEGAFAQKLEDLAILYEAYDSICAQGKRDPGSRMDYLLQELQTSDYAQEHVFYVDGFPDFTNAHMQVLQQILLDAPYVCVSLCCDRPGSENTGFEKPGQTAAALIEFAKERKIPYKVTKLEGRKHALSTLQKNLFGQTYPRADLSGVVTVYETESIRQECCAALEKISQLVQGGCRYRDVAIVCGDLPSYRPVLSLLAEQYHIPLYIAGKEDILTSPVISTVLSALEAAVGDYNAQDILRYVKSALSPVDEDARDLLENYAIVWGIRGKHWEEEWHFHPDGLDSTWNEEANQRLSRINAARRQLIEPLSRMRMAFRKATRVADQVTAIAAFLDEIGFADRLEAIAEETDDPRQVQILNQLWEILLGALEQIDGTLGETQWDSENFSRLLSLLLSQYDVGTIPATLDCVQTGALADLRCVQVRHLFVLGAEEGKFPGYPESSGLLTDRERRELLHFGVPITGTSMDVLQADFANIYSIFCGAEETVTVSCQSGNSSAVARQIAELSGGFRNSPAVLGPAAADQSSAGAFLAFYGEAGEAERLGVLDSYEKAKVDASFRVGNLTNQNVQALYGSKLRLSASQIDKAASCKMAYFLQYGLRAKERKEITIDPSQFGTFVHEVLELTAKEVVSLGGFRAVSLEKTLEIADKYADAYVKAHFADLDSERTAYLLHRNEREMKMVVEDLWQELSGSLFDPKCFELEFGEGKELGEIDIPGAKMEALVRGVVDRVDVYEKDGNHYFRIVDYKTGRKSFDYCDIENGVGLQMLLYLFALKNKGKELLGDPAIGGGVLYFPARVPVLTAKGKPNDEQMTSERIKENKRSGLLLDDNDVIHALDSEIAEDAVSVYRGNRNALNVDTADRDQWRQLESFTGILLRDLVNTIAEGNVEPDPYTRGEAHNPCNYCPYKTICHADTVPGRRNRKTVKNTEFWNKVEQVVTEHGN